jgi:ABC-type Fe3+-hydroxamate transport system substrate-binding protein
MFCVLFALLLLQPACGGSSSSQTPVSGTPPGNYTITVSATSGTDTKSATVTLRVP